MTKANRYSDKDLATLADWATDMIVEHPNPAWKKAYSLLREGADTVLRRRAATRETTPEPDPAIPFLYTKS